MNKIRPDVQAYLIQAGINVAKREGFQPQSIEQMAKTPEPPQISQI